MRLLTIVGIIFAMVVGAGVWINYSLHEASGRLAGKVQMVSADIRQDNWTAARRDSDQMKVLWKKDARWWPVVLDHQEIDNIEFSIARTTEYVKNQDQALAQGQLSELKLMVEHIPRKEAINLENIL